MSNEIQIFNNPEFGDVRVLEIEGEPWLVGKDVAEKLGYTNPQKAIRDHVDDEDKRGERIVHPSGGAQETIVINESGLYSLILSSKLPTAKKFKHWVTSEVLPAIRKTGSYGKTMSQVEILAQAAQQLVEQEKRLTAVEKRMDGVRDIVALSANGWRQDSAHLINRIAERLGGAEHISEVRKESYKFLNERMHADVAARLRNLKRKAAEEGMCKSKRDKLNYLDVIGQDPRLIEGYTIVVKDMAIRYGVADEM
ncbi:MAG: Bro-N domain-containing protein [Selenomonas sp.]|uniref:BRO-N domain-containing protein n=1 Tax=Selenomonas sp. TaxID=2053611 RepID=UPI0025D662D3|nr:Bro-N domain-containing protein [Selenomonas sp.]MCR5438017.1 Bro-N domain-containing protein [Selenomonas sp.]